MAAEGQAPSSWVYPDRDAWEKLLHLRPKPRPVMEKPAWWRGSWPAAWPGKPTEGAQSNERKLEAVRRELAWAQKCFYYAESVLANSHARDKARRIADTLGRARRSLDTPDKADQMDYVAQELAGVGRYDPAKHPRAFVEASGRSLSAAGGAMATSRHESVGYWGRVLVRAGGFFRAMKQELPEGT